jgi:hypothetical protein
MRVSRPLFLFGRQACICEHLSRIKFIRKISLSALLANTMADTIWILPHRLRDMAGMVKPLFAPRAHSRWLRRNCLIFEQCPDYFLGITLKKTAIVYNVCHNLNTTASWKPAGESHPAPRFCRPVSSLALSLATFGVTGGNRTHLGWFTTSGITLMLRPHLEPPAGVAPAISSLRNWRTAVCA